MAEYEQKVSVGLLEVILQELQDAHQTGILTVQRSKAGVRDVGTITILHGEPVEAHAGERLGNDAIQWLYTWGRCQCEFLPQAPGEIVISPPPPIAQEVETSLSPLAFLSRLRIGRNQDAPEPDHVSRPEEPEKSERPTRPEKLNEPMQRPFAPGPVPNIVRGQPRALPETPAPPPFRSPQPSFRTAQSDSDALFSDWLQNGNQPRPQVPPPPAPQLPAPQLPAPQPQAPHRLWQGQDALTFLERARASRLHRHVFLLLDGQRTIADLVRITGHSFEEVSRLLNDLERMGIIKQEHPVRVRW